jgi:hypothetical protein
VIPRPRPAKRKPQNLCVDKGDAGKAAERQIRARGCLLHIPTRTPLKGGTQNQRTRPTVGGGADAFLDEQLSQGARAVREEGC